jgi:hypothetical protein
MDDKNRFKISLLLLGIDIDIFPMSYNIMHSNI